MIEAPSPEVPSSLPEEPETNQDPVIEPETPAQELPETPTIGGVEAPKPTQELTDEIFEAQQAMQQIRTLKWLTQVRIQLNTTSDDFVSESLALDRYILSDEDDEDNTYIGDFDVGTEL